MSPLAGPGRHAIFLSFHSSFFSFPYPFSFLFTFLLYWIKGEYARHEFECQKFGYNQKMKMNLSL